MNTQTQPTQPTLDDAAQKDAADKAAAEAAAREEAEKKKAAPAKAASRGGGATLRCKVLVGTIVAEGEPVAADSDDPFVTLPADEAQRLVDEGVVERA